MIKLASLLIGLFLSILLWPSLVHAANRFLTCNTTCTITAADTSIWGSSSGGTGASVPGSSDAVILDGATCVGGTTCTATMGAAYNPTWQTLTMGACTASTSGCILTFATNNNNITLNATNTVLSLTGTGVRTLNMGSGTWTLSGATPIIDTDTATNLTLSGASATISYTSASPVGARTFSTGAKTWGNIIIAANSTGYSTWFINGATFTSLTVGAGVHLNFQNGHTFTITTLTMNCTTAALCLVRSQSQSTETTLALTTANIVGMAANLVTFTGSPTATSSYSLGGVTGITIVAPAAGANRIFGGGF